MRFSFTCPNTGQSFEREPPKMTGRQVAMFWRKDIWIPCPACGETHRFDFNNVYQRAVLDDLGSAALAKDTSGC